MSGGSGQSLIVDTLTTTGQVLVIPGLTVNIIIPRLTVIFKPLSYRAVKIKYMCIQYSRFEVHTHFAIHLLLHIGYHRTCLLSLLKFSFRFPTTYRAHTRHPATSLLEEDRIEGYDCHHNCFVPSNVCF